MALRIVAHNIYHTAASVMNSTAAYHTAASIMNSTAAYHTAASVFYALPVIDTLLSATNVTLIAQDASINGFE